MLQGPLLASQRTLTLSKRPADTVIGANIAHTMTKLHVKLDKEGELYNPNSINAVVLRCHHDAEECSPPGYEPHQR